VLDSEHIMCDFVLPDGSTFDTNVGIFDDPPPFLFYEKVLTCVKERLGRYGLRPTAVKALQTISAECGDDEISVDNNPVYAATKMVIYSEFLGMKESIEDTSINPRFGNYAEDLVIVPDGYEQTYRYCQQTSNFKNMAFLDVPKLRLAIDIRPGRMNHSSTNDGKAGMLGSRLAWLPIDSPVRCTFEIFNLMQDINLGLIRDDKFAYLPTALGGYGKPIPFGLASNFEAFCVRYKQGTHQGFARELVRRTNRRFNEYTVENRFSTDPVLSAVARLQSSWHDWIKGKSLYAPTCWLEAPPEVMQYRVAKHGVDVRIDSVLRRLEAQGLLVPENDLAIAYEHNLLCKSLLESATHKEFLAERKRKRSEWNNMSTFSMRLFGFIQPLLVDQSLQGPLPDLEVGTFLFNITRRRVNLRSFLREENFYDIKAKDLVYLKGPMMVQMAIMPRITTMGRRYWFEQTRDSDTQEFETPEEFELLLTWIKGNPTENNPPSTRILDDDPFIIKEIQLSSLESAFCIITDDVNLCRDAYMRTRKWVLRVPTKWYYTVTYFGDGNSPWEDVAKARWPMFSWQTIQDTGSIESFEEKGFRDGELLQEVAERPFSMTKPSFKNLRRVRQNRSQHEVEAYDWEPYRFPDGYLFAPNGRFLEKRRHPMRRGWA
jgi:hypothetical protein